MKARNKGVVVFVSSSGAAPYMGAYEVFKTTQVELCNTLSAELEGTGVITYSIGPGLVKTETAQRGIELVSSLMGITLDEFYEINEKFILDVEMAGVGFAVSVVNGARYNGQEIGSIQAFHDAGILERIPGASSVATPLIEIDTMLQNMRSIVDVFNEQYYGWLSRSLFERQWVLRDFKKTVGVSADNFLHLISTILVSLEKNDLVAVVECKPWLEKLKVYYLHQHKLLQGFEKDSKKLEVNSQILLGWVNDLQTMIDML
jgi:hypothetical protein